MKKTTVIVLVIVLVMIVGLGFGMRMVMNYFTQKAGDNIASTLLSKATGGKVNVDTSNGNNSVSVSTPDGSMSFGSSSKLPSGFPSSVPTPSFGKISGSASTSTGSNGTSYTVTYDLTSAEAATAGSTYRTQLAAGGFAISDETTMNSETGNYQSFTGKNGTYQAYVVLTVDSTSTSTLMLVVTNETAN